MSREDGEKTRMPPSEQPAAINFLSGEYFKHKTSDPTDGILVQRNVVAMVRGEGWRRSMCGMDLYLDGLVIFLIFGKTVIDDYPIHIVYTAQ